MITVPKIQLALRNDTFKTSEVSAPNIFLWPPFESDFVRVTKSGYAIEYEIKLSKSDFRADFNKAKIKFEGYENRQVKYSSTTKHDWLDSGAGPTEFYYVFPKGMIDIDNVPEWCGVIEVEDYYYPHIRKNKILLWHTRKAKRLNKTPLSESKKKNMYVSCYYRYWDLANRRNTNHLLML